MSGHSHWHSIKGKKGLADAKKSKAFSKVNRLISVAAREGGPDAENNPRLRIAIEQAKSINMPADNIERAIKKGSGELEGTKLEPVIFEAMGPGNIAIIIEGITDNKNRALSEIKQALNQNQGKLTGEGSVKWLFEKKGVLNVGQNSIDPFLKEDIELKAIEAGAEDILWMSGNLNIYTKAEGLSKVKKKLEEQGIKIESISLEWIAKEYISVEDAVKESCQKLFEVLDDIDSVQEIYSNLET